MSFSSFSSSIPKWLQLKIPEINKSGKMDCSKDGRFNVESLKIKQFSPYFNIIRYLNISNTSITDLSSFPKFPALTTFIANQTQISSFTNFSVLLGITKISLKDTPISHEKSYLISLTALLSPNLSIIDGKIISESTKEKAKNLGKLVCSLIDSGWIMPIPIPNSYEIMDECHKRGISFDSSDFDEFSSSGLDKAWSVASDINSMSDDFDITNVSENDKQLAQGLSNIFADFGIEIEPTNYRELLAAVADCLN